MKKLVVPALAVLLLIYAIHAVLAARQVPQISIPPEPPPQSPYSKYVAGVGLVEANTENIAIGAAESGIVTDVYRAVGDRVRVGDPLFRIDSRDQEADVAVKKAAVASAHANVEVALATLEDMDDQWSKASALYNYGVDSKDERDRKHYARSETRAKLHQARADLSLAVSQLNAAQTELDRHTVRAPVAGELLQVKIHRGEYAASGVLDPPLILIGNIEPMNVRVDIDEQNAWRVTAGSAAVAAVRGNSGITVPLRFVRFEPYVIPKKSLTGDIIERTDTRVLQVIFSLANEDGRIHLGQQMDVFIEDVSDEKGD